MPASGYRAHRELATAEAEHSLVVFRALGVETYPTGPLLADALALSENSTFDDALYVALARRLDEPLATTDRRLARAAAGAGVPVVSPP